MFTIVLHSLTQTNVLYNNGMNEIYKIFLMNMNFILMILVIKIYYFDPYKILFGYCQKYTHSTCDWFCDHKLREHLNRISNLTQSPPNKLKH